MKFDIIVGNPPYNPDTKEDRGGNGSANKIWHKFVELAHQHCSDDGHIAFVTPAGWRCGSTKQSQHRHAQKMIFDRGIIAWNDARNPINYFPTVGHSIGIDWWITGKNGIYIPSILSANKMLPRSVNDINFLEKWLTLKSSDDCYVIDISGNDRRKFNHIPKSKSGDNKHLYPHLNTGGNTRKDLFDWYDEKTSGFDISKIIVHDSSGPEPFYDKKGKYGCGTHSCGYTVQNNNEAQDIINFFSSDLMKKIVRIFSTEGSLGFPLGLFVKIPKSWKSLNV